MISSPELSKLLVCTFLLVGGCSRANEKNEELAQVRAELNVARADAAQARADLEVARGEAAKARAEAEATKAALPKPRQPAKITFAIHAYDGLLVALAWGPLKAEFEKRGFSCKLVRSPKTETKTPNQDMAKVMVLALKNVEGDIVLVGISGHGLFMPLVAAERPIRRIVMINAVVPSPGKSFQEAFDFEKVFATKFARRLAEAPPECRRFARSRNCRRSSMSTSAAKRTTRYGRNGSSGPCASICMSNRSSSEARATRISCLVRERGRRRHDEGTLTGLGPFRFTQLASVLSTDARKPMSQAVSGPPHLWR